MCVLFHYHQLYNVYIQKWFSKTAQNNTRERRVEQTGGRHQKVFGSDNIKIAVGSSPCKVRMTPKRNRASKPPQNLLQTKMSPMLEVSFHAEPQAPPGKKQFLAGRSAELSKEGLEGGVAAFSFKTSWLKSPLPFTLRPWQLNWRRSTLAILTKEYSHFLEPADNWH